MEEQAPQEGIDTGGTVDGLANFRDSFENTIVVFILRGEQQRDQLSRRDSFFSAAQRSLQRPLPSGNGGEKGKRRASRTAIVTNASGAVDAVRSVVTSLDKSRCAKRELYFRNTAGSHLHPSSRPSQGAIADHVVREFNKWSDRTEMLEEGEANVVLHMMGSLENLVTASLQNVPIRNQGKRICEFFGNPVDGIENSARSGRDSSEREFCDDVDDRDPLSQSQSYFQTERKAPLVPDPAFTGGTQQFTPMVPSKLSFGRQQQQSIFPAEYGPPHDFQHSSHAYEHVNGSGAYDQHSRFAEANTGPEYDSEYAGHVRAECPPTNPHYMYDGYQDQRYDGDFY